MKKEVKVNEKKEKIIRKAIYYILIFLVGCFVGWLYEVGFYFYDDHIFVNSGVLYGPWLPIYGTGAIFISFLKPFKKHPVLIFLAVMLVTGILEYAVGYYVYHVNNMKLWDYTGLFLNIDGFVCFRSVFTFAIGGLLLMYGVLPLIDKIMNKISQNKLLIFCIIFIIVFVADIILSNLYRTPITY